MKTQFTFLVLFCAMFLSAQTRLFETPVNENRLNDNQKIGKELASNYRSTHYYIQSSPDLKSDLQIPLPTGEEIIARYNKTYAYANKSESYVYSIENAPHAELVLSKYGNIVTGMYAPEQGEKVVFHQTDERTFAVSVLSDTKILDQDTRDDYILDKNMYNEISNKANSNVCSSSTAVCPATRIDVLVVYTPAARTAWGGAAQSNSYIATAITNFNTSLTNSGVSNVTINLVYSGEIAYTESGSLSTDLPRFRNNNDGYMDSVHTLRTTYGADLCALVVGSPTNTCGLGYLNTSSTNYSSTAGFNVSLYNCAVSNYSLAHELGHNVGLRHDWYVDSSTTPCNHHHGYTNKTAVNSGTSSTTSQRWRTIMAYNNECASQGISCTRINRWANPNANYNGEPTGVAIGSTNPANEAFGFARFACVVSNFTTSTTRAAMITTREESTPSLASREFKIYPNPAKDVINVQGGNGESYNFKVYNITGLQIISTSETTIPLKGWLPGEYFLNIYNKNNTLIESKKFIVR